MAVLFTYKLESLANGCGIRGIKHFVLEQH